MSDSFVDEHASTCENKTDSESSHMAANSTNESDVIQCTGIVKWFNSKSGFGFITILDKELKGEDVFVHHTSIYVNKKIYKTLIQGEYVQVSVRETTGQHKYIVDNVTGIFGGLLMCETKAETSRRSGRLSNDEN